MSASAEVVVVCWVTAWKKEDKKLYTPGGEKPKRHYGVAALTREREIGRFPPHMTKHTATMNDKWNHTATVEAFAVVPTVTYVISTNDVDRANRPTNMMQT